MRKQISFCPVCAKGTLAFDCINGSVVLSRGRKRPDSCPHLVCFNICFEAGWLCAGGVYHRSEPPSSDWLWVRNLVPLHNGAVEPDRKGWRCFLDDWFADNPLEPVLAPRGKFRIIGGTAGQRDKFEPHSGTFIVDRGDGLPLYATLDAWAVYGPRPGELAAVLAQLVIRRDMLIDRCEAAAARAGRRR